MGLSASHTKRVNEDLVMAIPEPQFTRSWRPVGHRRVITALAAACNSIELQVRDKEYSINQSGSRMFGVWHLEHGKTQERGLSLGFRNSIDKSMVVGIAAGTKVFVCDNLAFSGEYLQFHKHTSGLTDKRLFGMAQEAVERAVPKMLEFDNWQSALKKVTIPPDDFKPMVYDAMDAGVFAPGQFNRFHDCFTEELKLSPSYPTLWGFYGAVTRLHRGQSLFHVADRTKRLNALITKYTRDWREQGQALPEILN